MKRFTILIASICIVSCGGAEILSTDPNSADGPIILIGKAPTPNPEPTQGPATEPTSEPESTPRSEPTPKPEPTSEPKPTPRSEPTPKPEPTSAPKPTSTPKPTATPRPESTPQADSGDLELIDISGKESDLVAGSFKKMSPTKLATRGTQSKRSVHQGGFGTDTKCGYDGKVVKVTNLNDKGKGSLREAVEMDEPRTIVFEVSGAIKLKSRIIIDSPYLTIAGQTAPPPGISLYHKALRVHTHDVCIQHIRVRLGDENAEGKRMSSQEAQDGDAVVIRGGKDPKGTYNVILDNTSISWSVDEAVSIFSGADDITIRDSIIAEPLRDSAQGKFHAYCLFLKSGSNRVSVIGNLFAHCQRRNPRVDGGSLQYVNNYVYNPGEYAIHSHNDPIDITMVGNVMKFPSDSDNRWDDGGAEAFFSSRTPTARVFFKGNESVKGRPLHEPRSGGKPVKVQSTPKVWEGNVQALSANSVNKSLLSWVGAFPNHRDEVDARVVKNVRNRKGTYLDSQNDAGGFIYVQENYRSLDVPRDPHGDDDNDGISNLIAWLQTYIDDIE